MTFKEIFDNYKTIAVYGMSTNDAKPFWLQEGIINDEAKKLAEENEIEFIQDKCMYKEYQNL